MVQNVIVINQAASKNIGPVVKHNKGSTILKWFTVTFILDDNAGVNSSWLIVTKQVFNLYLFICKYRPKSTISLKNVS